MLSSSVVTGALAEFAFKGAWKSHRFQRIKNSWVLLPLAFYSAVCFSGTLLSYGAAITGSGIETLLPEQSTGKQVGFSPDALAGSLLWRQQSDSDQVISMSPVLTWELPYKKVVTSVLFLDTPTGTGTGFVVDAGGWILTNYHVAATGALDLNGHRTVTVEPCRLREDGSVERTKLSVPALVYKWDESVDLALLRVAAEDVSTSVVEALPAVRLRDSPPQVGEPLAAIGNSGKGFMWSLKPGFVSGVAKLSEITNIQVLVNEWMKERMESAASNNLALIPEANESELQALVRGVLETRYVNVKMIQSTAQTAHGDSGGPVVDLNGELLGVVCRYFGNDDTDPYNYDIHVDEVREFLLGHSDAPLIDVPQGIWVATAVTWLGYDTNNNGELDTLVGLDSDEDLAVLALDADEDSRWPAIPGASSGMNLEQLLAESQGIALKEGFDGEFALLFDWQGPRLWALYDVRNEGEYGEVLLDANVDLQLESGFEMNGANGTMERIAGVTNGALLKAADSLPSPCRDLYAKLRRQLSTGFRAVVTESSQVDNANQ